ILGALARRAHPQRAFRNLYRKNVFRAPPAKKLITNSSAAITAKTKSQCSVKPTPNAITASSASSTSSSIAASSFDPLVVNNNAVQSAGIREGGARVRGTHGRGGRIHWASPRVDNQVWP